MGRTRAETKHVRPAADAEQAWGVSQVISQTTATGGRRASSAQGAARAASGRGTVSGGRTQRQNQSSEEREQGQRISLYDLEELDTQAPILSEELGSGRGAKRAPASHAESYDRVQRIRKQQRSEAGRAANGFEHAEIGQELADVMECWASLSADIRAAILAVVRASV